MSGETDPTDPERLRVKIQFILGIYPVLNPSMLQLGIGPSIPPRVWRPVLEQMIVDGIVSRSEVVTPTPFGQHRSYTKLSLAKKD